MGDPWPEPGEPLYRDEDTEEVLAFIEWEGSLCPNCGEPKAECFDKANQYAYVADVLTCHACAAASRATDKVTRTLGADFTNVRKR